MLIHPQNQNQEKFSDQLTIHRTRYNLLGWIFHFFLKPSFIFFHGHHHRVPEVKQQIGPRVDKPACLIIRFLFGFVSVFVKLNQSKTNTETVMLSCPWVQLCLEIPAPRYTQTQWCSPSRYLVFFGSHKSVLGLFWSIIYDPYSAPILPNSFFAKVPLNVDQYSQIIIKLWKAWEKINQYQISLVTI